MKRLVPSERLIAALQGCGLVPENTRRVIIDLNVDALPVLHVECYGDESLLELVQAVTDEGITTSVEQSQPSGRAS